MTGGIAALDLRFAGDLGRDVAGEDRLFRVVEGDWIVRRVVDLGGRAVGGGQSGRDRLQALFRVLADRLAQACARCRRARPSRG